MHALIASSVLIGGCDGHHGQSLGGGMNVKCIAGVEYYFITEREVLYKGYGYMSPKYNRDGKISLCGNS